MCKHKRDTEWCTECRYGKVEEVDTLENPYDFYDEIKRGLRYKILTSILIEDSFKKIEEQG